MTDYYERVVFLDLDGVLVHPINGGRRTSVCIDCVRRLNRITESSGAAIVVTSSWRQNGNPSAMIDTLKSWGVTAAVVGQTPRLIESVDASGNWIGYCRGDEIAAWLADHIEVTTFVILDDAEEMGTLRTYLRKTDSEFGLTDEIVEKAIRGLLSKCE